MNNIGFNKLAQINKYTIHIVITTVLLIGIFFRLTHIDYQVYSHDETYTSLRISGYTQEEVIKEVHESKIVNNRTLQKYQQTNPNKNLKDTINSIALEDAMHPPFYFVMVRYWMKLWSNLENKVLVIRSLSVLFSLLVFPCLYWLCLELFKSNTIGWIAVALVSISPFHVVYAQEARQYSLVTLIILLSSALLLRAIRVKTDLSWLLYGIALILGLYTHLFFILVPIGHVFYILKIENFYLKSKNLRYHLLSFVIAFIFFIPWLLVIIANLSAINRFTKWAQKDADIIWFSKEWLLGLSRVVIDFNSVFSDKNIFIYLTLILTLFSLYYLYRYTTKETWLFVFSLILSTFIGLLISDIVRDGILSSTPRYLIPCYLGIQIAIAHFIAREITSLSNSIWRQRSGKILMFFVITSGIVSCYLNFESRTWWNKHNNYNFYAAEIINQSDQPLLISESIHGKFGNLMSISHSLDPEVKIRILVEPKVSTIPQEFKHIFVYLPSKELKLNIEKEYNNKLIQVLESYPLWKIE